MEIWKDIEGYEGLYQVSDIGRVKSLDWIVDSHEIVTQYLKKGKILSLCLTTNGYYNIGLYKDGKRKHISVHRLVAKEFIPNPLNLPEVNHKWGNKIDNRATELEWTTKKENMLHSYKTLHRINPNKGKFGKESSNAKPVLQCDLNGNIIREWESAKSASRIGKFNSGEISNVCRGHSKQHKGFIWRNVQSSS